MSIFSRYHIRHETIHSHSDHVCVCLGNQVHDPSFNNQERVPGVNFGCEQLKMPVNSHTESSSIARLHLRWAFQPSTRILTSQGSLAIIKVTPQQSRGLSTLRMLRICVSIEFEFRQSSRPFTSRIGFAMSKLLSNSQTALSPIRLTFEKSYLFFSNHNWLSTIKIAF